MSGIMNMVSRFTRSRTTSAAPVRGRRPTPARGVGRAPHARGTSAGLEGMARKLIRRAR